MEGSKCGLRVEFEITHVDEFVDMILIEENVCDIMLPRIPKRAVL